MLSVSGIQSILLAQWRVDFRKGHLGLLGECRRAGVEPWKGCCVVFVSKCKTRVKVLIPDSTGLWVSYKLFAKGKISTKLKFLENPSTVEISQADLAMLIEGNSYLVTKRKKEWKPRYLDK